MKYYIIAGEASGDLHGANLITALKEEDNRAEFQFWGGDKMSASANKEPFSHIKDLAFMGFVEVVANLRTILGNIKKCKTDIQAFKPDALVLIDYPGFNLRIAKWAKKQGFKVFYYISPQIWAWKEKRVHSIIKNTEEVYTILPFEKEFYAKFGYTVKYVGHPLLDELKKKKNFNKIQSEKPIVALLPGSRKQEIKKMLPLMNELAKEFRQFQFIVGKAPSIGIDFYDSIIQNNGIVIHNHTYELLETADFALVTSGTATLETALFNVPQLVCYRGSRISYQIAKRLIRVKYISLVNLILDQPLIKEIIQGEYNLSNLKLEFENLISSQEKEKIRKGYSQLWDKLDENNSSGNVAANIISKMKKGNTN